MVLRLMQCAECEGVGGFDDAVAAHGVVDADEERDGGAEGEKEEQVRVARRGVQA